MNNNKSNVTISTPVVKVETLATGVSVCTGVSVL